jgi:integrase
LSTRNFINPRRGAGRVLGLPQPRRAGLPGRLQLQDRGKVQESAGESALQRPGRRRSRRGFEARVGTERPPIWRGLVVIRLNSIRLHCTRSVPTTHHAIPRLLDAANPHLRGVITALLDTACRPGEILSLEWRDVSIERRELTIRAENEKTRRERIIPISCRLLAVLLLASTETDCPITI